MADTMTDTASAIRMLPDALRTNFRCRAEGIEAAGKALGLAVPAEACRANVEGERAILWLGPDEWLLRTAVGDESWTAPLPEALAGIGHSLVDISHRQVALLVSGRDAATILASACPLPLDEASFPIGMCTRTVFAKAEILLWRTVEGFVVEVWRSFAPYVRSLLEQAERDARY